MTSGSAGGEQRSREANPDGPPPPRLSREDAGRALELLGASAEWPVALLRAHQGIYFARGGSAFPRSPVVRLLRGIYEREPRRAVWIVRNRIFSSAAPLASCAGAVKVAARRLEAPVAPEPGPLAPAHLAAARVDVGRSLPPARRSHPALEPALAEIVASALSAMPPPSRAPYQAAGASGGAPDLSAPADAAWLSLAARLAAHVEGAGLGAPGTDRPDKPIAALAVSAREGLLGWAVNTGSHNATLHAESNLLDVLASEGRLPLAPDVTIYASLKPCKMCAGLIWDAASDPALLRVRFLVDDPQRYARETVLDRGSEARRSFARDEREREAGVQEGA